MAIIDRYKASLARVAKALKLTADHPYAARRQFDAMDLLGDCEDWRAWRPQDDLGLKYRRQAKQLGHARNGNRLAKSLQLVAKDLLA